jgi:hypothetical protein
MRIPVQTGLARNGEDGMPLDLESLSDAAKTVFLARMAHTLTICARDTYEVGTDDVREAQTLCAYNELLHVVSEPDQGLQNMKSYISKG